MARLLHEMIDLIFPQHCPQCAALIGHNGLCEDCLACTPRITPPLCPLCGRPFAAGDDHLCASCLRGRPFYDRVRACFAYEHEDGSEPPLISVLHRWKYHRDVTLAPYLRHLLVRHGPPCECPQVVVPVPLHRARLRWRGFNQSVILARALAQALGLPHADRALARVRPTRPQVELDRTERGRNVRGAFSVRNPRAVRGRNVLLVDDVLTTGSTANECARALRAAGAEKVEVRVLARALARGSG